MTVRGWLWSAGLIVVGAAAWWWWRDANRSQDAVVLIDAGVAPRSTPTLTTAAARPAIEPALRDIAPAPPFDAATHHTADPCASITEPAIPPDDQVITTQGITLAWAPATSSPGPNDTPFSPIVVAHVVAGLLEEAAVLTGTERRAELTVIVDASRADLLLRTGAPAWADGLYDGAVHVHVEALRDLHVGLPTLRHEVMHAQLHAAIGCVPFWFNEGLAMYFAGVVPIDEWIAMIRTADQFAPSALQDGVSEVSAADAGRLYARAFAMIVYVVEQGGLQDAVRAAETATTRSAALALWDRVYPSADGKTVVDGLARSIFGVGPGPALDAILGLGAICCRGLRTVDDLRCTGAPPHANDLPWTERSVSPRLFCKNKW